VTVDAVRAEPRAGVIRVRLPVMKASAEGSVKANIRTSRAEGPLPDRNDHKLLL
jgi:hypothetical protein